MDSTNADQAVEPRDCALTVTLQMRPSDFDREFAIRFSAIADLMQDIRSAHTAAQHARAAVALTLTWPCCRWRWWDQHNDELPSMAMQDGLTNISGVRAAHIRTL